MPKIIQMCIFIHACNIYTQMSVSAIGEARGPYMPNALENYYEPPEGEDYVGRPLDDEAIALRNRMIEVHRTRMMR